MSFRDLFLLNAKDYLGTVADVYINVILLAVAVALCLACLFINYHKTYTVIIIKQILRRGATDEKNALTLSAMRLDGVKGLKAALNRNGQLSRIVRRVGFTQPTYEEYMAMAKERREHRKNKDIPKEERKAARREERKAERAKIDFSAARFYIPEENLKKAELIKEKENPTIVRTILVCVLILALTVCFMLLMPAILRLISNVEI